jgi:Cas10/Cmr2, second palm domain
MNLVLIETSGNQQYIFATNKLRENVGASELTYRVGTEWVLDSVKRVGGPDLWDEDATKLRQNLLNQADRMPHATIEVIVATSGKAMLLAGDEKIGRAIIEQVTGRALKDAPGIDVCGIVSDPIDWERPLGQTVGDLHKQLDVVRNGRPGVGLRFLRLPVVMECGTSGLPAALWDAGKPGGEGPTARSAVTIGKREGSKSYGPRMKRLLRLQGIDRDFAENIGDLEKYCEWLAVVHADGNGVGQVFLDFWDNSGCAAKQARGEDIAEVNSEYIESYRKFSIALDVCTEEAFIAALRNLQARKDKLRSLQRIKEQRDAVVPILPILLGGDDLTMVCDGQAALQFTQEFLTEFERQTARKDLPLDLNDIVPKIAAASSTAGTYSLSACAGVAIVKPHFPFSAAYELAEQLIISAKTMKPSSALDFHALYDSSGSDLDRVREKLQVDEGKTWLYARPYVVTPHTGPEGIPETTELHDWQRLEARVKAIFAKDDDGRHKLPNSQLHDLRGGLFLGKESANARYRLIRRRYEQQGIAEFGEPGEDRWMSLFWWDTINKVHRTRLLDALDAANFWVEDNEENKTARGRENAR